MTDRVSILYTYRNPWPRRLALMAAVLLLLGATSLTTAHFGGDARRQGCTSAASR